MLKSFFATAFRNLLKNKSFSIINILGLSIGMASATLLLLLIVKEVSFDKFHSKKDRLYQIYVQGANLETTNSSPAVLTPYVQANFPKIEEIARTNQYPGFIISANDKHLEGIAIMTDPGFLKMFDFPLIKGNPNTALSESRSIVLTEKMAHKFFGDEEAMGKNVSIDSNKNFIVTGIMKDLPSNTKFDFDYLIPFTYKKEVGWLTDKWTDFGVQTYVLLKPGVTAQTANNFLDGLITKNDPTLKAKVFLHPVELVHLYGWFENGKPRGLIEMVRLFSILAAFILLIACINYMNLNTARSEKRSKEVGIRKVMGAEKRMLVFQFLGESIIISFIAACLALVMAQLFIPQFNQLVGNGKIEIPYYSPTFWACALGFIFLTGIIAGLYPAFYLSAKKPISVLKGYFKSVHALITPRKILVVFQFSFAIVFIICTIVVYRQIKLGQSRDLGYNMDNLAFMYVRGDVNKNFAVIKSELYKSGAIELVTRSNSPVTMMWTWDNEFEWPQKDPNQKQYFGIIHSDNDYVKTMGLTITKGRDINTYKHPSDTMAVLLNETAVKQMNFENPVGQLIKNKDGAWRVVGVVKDFLTGSPFNPSDGVIIEGPKNWFGAITFKLNSARRTSDNIQAINRIMTKYNPDYPSPLLFVKDSHEDKFGEDRQIGKLAFLFALLSIIISCMGLYALSTYMAETRVKEIGIRKVLGASASSIIMLISSQFLKLIVIALIVASPIAWWMMNKWLQDFTYRVNITWWIFMLTGIISIAIAVITIFHRSYKAAVANPVRSLRTE